MRRFAIVVVVAALCIANVGPARAGVPQQAQDSQKQAAPAETGKPDTTKPEVVEPAKAMPVGVSVDPHGYKLGPDDIIFVQVWREPDLSGSLSIRPDGKITLPVIKEVAAAGMTPSQLEQELSKRFAEFVKNPQVTVVVQSVRSKRYYLEGEINRPGAYPLGTPITVFEALAMGGGFREFSNKKKIMIIRGAKRFQFNWNEVVKGKNLSQNIQLENGDHVIVP